jgi:ribosome biogenesis protein Nip4
MKSGYIICLRKHEGKRLFRKKRHRWEDNIRMELREIGWDFVDWMHLAQDRYQWQVFVNMVMNLQVP